MHYGVFVYRVCVVDGVFVYLMAWRVCLLCVVDGVFVYRVCVVDGVFVYCVPCCRRYNAEPQAARRLTCTKKTMTAPNINMAAPSVVSAPDRMDTPTCSSMSRVRVKRSSAEEA